MGELDGTGVARPVGGREHVPCLPGHDDGATGVRWHGRDMRRARGCWAAPGGVARGLGPLLAATGGEPPQKLPTPVRLAATDARKAPRTRVKLRTGGRACEERAKCTVYA